ncbi:unnamed protein product [Ectocarpus sp. CCAP 1310/34]|nr:unnamed protein product [Ectocarpus sp. CCAP 1310/34]
MATLGPISASEIIEALLVEQRASDAMELPKVLIQDVESESGSYQEARQSKYSTIWGKAMSAEFEGLLRAGTFALAEKAPLGCNKSVSGLMATLGPISASEIIEALLVEQRASDAMELPKVLIQDVESESGSYQEARQSKYSTIWGKAMSAEFEGLLRAGTFALAEKAPLGCNVINARWVYKWKADETGKIVKAEARLVAEGFKQKHVVDYLGTFSPTANASSIRLLVALACKYDLEFFHFEIEQAFVQSELDHEVFMKLPPGCKSMTGKVVRIDKSLYGLRQASRTFHKRLVSDLNCMGFEQSLSDPCVLRFVMGDEVLGMIAIHVDDILYAGIERLATMVVEALGDSLPTKNLGKVRSVMEDEGAGDVPFREVVGSLMWIANQTRLDISNAVRAVARHSHEPKTSHRKAAQKILSYVLETAHLTLMYKQDTMVDVGTLEYVDADIASKTTDRRSISGAIVLVADCLVAWISRTQKCVTLSTTEAEYDAMGDGCKRGFVFQRNARVLEA